jgi:hypothetical protein
MDKVRKPNISESYTPSSESYSNYQMRCWVNAMRFLVILVTILSMKNIWFLKEESGIFNKECRILGCGAM